MSSRQPDPKNANTARQAQPAHRARIAGADEPTGGNGPAGRSEPTGGCPSSRELDEFLASNLGDAELEEIAAHVNTCEACRRHVTGEPQHAALADDLRFANKQYLETPPTVSMPLTRLNELLDDYNIISEIGRGGMGIVYEALHLKLNRRVALKVLPTLLSAVRPDAIERFQREAELAARLKHTNIIAVHDFGDIEGTLFYTMELIEGRSLRDLLCEINDTGAIDVVIGGNERSAVSSQPTAVSRKPEDLTAEIAEHAEENYELRSTKYERRGEEESKSRNAGNREQGTGSREQGTGNRRKVQRSKEDAVSNQPSAVSQKPREDPLTSSKSEIRNPKSEMEMTRIGSSHHSDRAYFRKVAEWIADVAEALDYAHGLGVIHRDIKPSNLLLAVDGRMMISDFGLARANGAQSLTASRSLLGTCRYMSPEQVDDSQDPIDHRIDVYALGATLYELLSFRPMFAATDDREVLGQVLSKEPAPPHRFVRQVPRELETICLKAVEKDRAARYQTAKAVAQDLRRWLLDLPIHARRPSLPTRALKFVRRRKVASALAASLAVVLIASSFLYAGYRTANRKAVAVQIIAEDQGLRLVVFEARSRLSQGRFEAALTLVEQELATHPDTVSLQTLRAQALLRLRRRLEAVQYLEELVALHPNSGAPHCMLASAYRNLDDPDKAAYHREQVERLMPDSASSFYVRAVCEADPAQATEWLNKAIELDPTLVEYVYERAQRLGELGRYQAMLLDAERAVAMHSGWFVTYHLRGKALLNLGQRKEALRDFRRAIELGPEHAALWYNSAVVRCELGRFAEAAADASEAIRLDREHASAFGLRGRARAGMGDLDGGIADCDRAINIDPTVIEFYLQRSALLHRAGRLEEAVVDCTRAIQLKPDDERAYGNRGRCYTELKQYDRAIADFTQYIHLQPDRVGAYGSRADAYMLRGEYSQAITDRTRVLSMNPPNPAAEYRRRATAYRRMNQHDEAIADLTQALEINPNDASTLMVRGMVYEISGAIHRALTDYRQTEAIGGPAGEYARLWMYALLRQTGRDQAAAGILTAHTSTETNHVWTNRLFDLFLGTLSADKLLAAAATDDERAEAHYYIGMYALLDGEEDAAVEALKKCVALNRTDILETAFARARLRQLESGPMPTPIPHPPGQQ